MSHVETAVLQRSWQSSAIEWGLLGAALTLVTTAHTWTGWTCAAVGALAAWFVLRAYRGVMWPYRTGMEAPLGVFLVSAGVAVGIAYDPFPALLQFSRMLAGVALFSLLVGCSTREQRWLAMGLVLAAAGLAVCWPLQHNFTANPVKFAGAQAVGLWVNARLPHLDLTSLTGVPIHSNVAAGTLVLALPFAVGLAWDGRHCRSTAATVVGVLGALAILVGLLLTSSRGAWLSLAVATGLAVSVTARRHKFVGGLDPAYLRAAVVIITLSIAVQLLATPDSRRVLARLAASIPSGPSRLALWRQGLSLIHDYPFTGSGLMTFPMVHATYALLIHTRFIAHAHNTVLEVWIEQGVVGALALIWGGWVTLGWARQAVHRSCVPPLGWAGLASVAAVALHGLVDVVFYVERTLPLLGLAFGYAWVAAGPPPAPMRRMLRHRSRCVFDTLLLTGAVACLHRPLLGTWYGNLGALEQTRQELSRYDPSGFYDMPLDRVRRAALLREAEARFRRALDWDSGNRTARQRLGQILLSRGEYAQALTLTQAGWDLGYRDDVSRLLHADALVAAGQVDAAVEAVQGLSWASGRFTFQGTFHYWPQADYRRAAYAWQAALLLDPTVVWLHDRLREAHEKLGP